MSTFDYIVKNTQASVAGWEEDRTFVPVLQQGALLSTPALLVLGYRGRCWDQNQAGKSSSSAASTHVITVSHYTCTLAMTGQGVPCCGTRGIFWSSGGRRSGGLVLSCVINRDPQSSGCYLAAHSVREGSSPSCRCSVTSGTPWRRKCHLREFPCPFHWLKVRFCSQVLVNPLVLATVCSPSQILCTSKE